MPKPKMTKEELLKTKIGNRSLQEWDLRWEPLANALSEKHAELSGTIGLFRTVLKGETMYIVCASERRGIEKGLQRIRGKDQVGNEKFGAQMIRKHREQLTVDILRVNDVPIPSNVAKDLKRAMVNLYDPHWAKPHRRRMQEIRDGTRPPD